MKRRFWCPIDAKKEYVAEVLAGGYRVEVVARRYGMSPKTLREWVPHYQDEVDDLMAKKEKEAQRMKQAAEQLPELQKKYDEAIKLIGEKELEISLLREIVKKNYPDWK